MTAVQHEPAQLGSGRPAAPAPQGSGRSGFPEPRHSVVGPSGAGRRAGGSTVGRRVARILALPAVVILLLLGVLSAQQIASYREASSTADAVRLSLEMQTLVSALQTERGVTAAVQGGNDSFTPELAPARTQVDAQRGVVQGLVGNGESGQVAAALSQLDGLSAIRATTDAGQSVESAERAATFDYYSERIAALAQVDLGLANSDDTELRRGLTAFRSLQLAIEGMSAERAFLNGVYSAGGFNGDEFVRLAELRAEYQYSLDQFDEYATPQQRESLAFIFSTGAAQVVQAFEQTALEAGDGRHLNVNPQSWWSGMGTLLDDANQLEQHVGSQIQLRAHELQQEAAQRIGLLLGGVVVCFAGSVYLSALASLSITRPLAALAAEADDLAAKRLPEAVRRAQTADPDTPAQRPAPVTVPDRATDEIRSVATALDRLQGAAYDLATEQAEQRRDTIESLANLGRRNQNLIRRQLGFITSLEREEVDPNALANLFELDHLATRMRRNAASLLVLVDASSPRTWSQTVPVSDVIRAAVSEVEEYRRVALRRVDEANVVGSAIGSVAHLLSELIENGLTFSPPDSEVEVQGRRIPDGYLIAITDQGVGMNPEELRIANSRLRGEGDFIAAPTRFLGHFVVGKLARDTGVRVELLPSPVTGVTARITLPAALLATSLSVEVRSLNESSPGIVAGEPAQLLALPRLDDLDGLDDLGGLERIEPIDRVPDDARELLDHGLGSVPEAESDFQETGLDHQGMAGPIRRDPGTSFGSDTYPGGQRRNRRAPEPGTLPGGIGIGPAANPAAGPQNVQDAQVRGITSDISYPSGVDLPVIEPEIEAAPAVPTGKTPAHRVDTDPNGLPALGEDVDGEGPDRLTGTPRWAKPGDLFARQFGPRSPEEQAAKDAARRRRDAPDNFTDLRTPATGITSPAAGSRPANAGPGSSGPSSSGLGGSMPGGHRPTGALRPAQARPVNALGPGSATRREVRVAGPADPATGGLTLPSERTQNGLRKRVPRNKRQGELHADGAARSRRVIDLDARTDSNAPRPVQPQTVADSPADVSARLTALRAGMRRGQASSSQESVADERGMSER
ncbi:sensor histidine kinase [Kineosporia babensis]|uniref:histidine kinase n=1 Tax=Kineosporia babensis TaxID=499548 RepID=A0A9X1NEG4_9ACTN|nr:nitrate- and nitrite sensing domain-containing protein [Kineosporia babensis]MCD5312214.1 nitrate- and nitrite sensing domain-containing protein [Kineosporia babensis]